MCNKTERAEIAMGVYVITDGEGSYIRRDDASGKYVPIKSFKNAMKLDSIAKANSILNNSIAKNIRSRYAVQFIDTDNIVEKENMGVQNDICYRNIIDDNIDEWILKINTIIDVLSGSDARNRELNIKLSDIDKEIVDVEHYIEFGKFNAYQGWMCFKMLQNLLKQRRKYKNEMQVISLIKQLRFDKNSLTELSQKISDIRNKYYTPRAIPELFRCEK